MVDESRNGDSKVRVVRLLGHRDDAGAWEIRDFLKRSVVEFQWIELLTEQPRLWRGSPVLEGLMSADAQPDALDVSFPTRRILAIVGDKWTTVVLYYLSHFQEDVRPDSAEPRTRRASGTHRLSARAAENGISAHR